MAQAKYTPTDAMMILPSAIGFTFEVPDSRANTIVGTSTVVEVCGPLTSRDECPFFDSYQAITERFAEALKDPTQRVVLLLDSPGGDVHSCFESVQKMRAMADGAGKPIIAYADRRACSAGYALACVADRIIINPTGTTGSIGVLLEREDITKALGQQGIISHFIATGSKKIFGKPEVPFTAEEEAELTQKANYLGEMFFNWVATRRNISVEQVAALQAGTFIGAQAVQNGLADEVASLDIVLSETFYQASSGESSSGETKYEASTVNLTECLAALTAIAESDSADSAAAKALLASMAAAPEEEKPAPEEDKKEASAEDKPEEAKAEDKPADDSEKPEEAPEEDKAAASAEDALASLKAEVAAAKAEVEALKSSAAFAEIKAKAAAHTSVDQKSGAKTAPKQKWEADLDRAMGIAKDETPKVSVKGNIQSFRL